MERVVPWAALVQVEPPHSAEGKTGHPRALVDSFTVASRAVRSAADAVKGFATFQLIRAVIHPMAKTEDGLTEVEERVQRELARGAGASAVVVWVGAPLSDDAAVQMLRQKWASVLHGGEPVRG